MSIRLYKIDDENYIDLNSVVSICKRYKDVDCPWKISLRDGGSAWVDDAGAKTLIDTIAKIQPIVSPELV